MSIKLRAKYQIRSFFVWLRSLSLPAWFDNTSARIVMSVFVVILSLGYVWQVSVGSTVGYDVHALEKNVAAAQSDIQKLEIEVAMNQSMLSIQKRLADVKMVPVVGVKYMNTDVAVAKR